jgi:hypothetical protein
MAVHAGRLETMRTAAEEKVNILRERPRRIRPERRAAARFGRSAFGWAQNRPFPQIPLTPTCRQG